MPYVIVQSPDSNEMAKGVSQLMDKGWLPTGGVAVSPASLMPLIEKYSQAMYKTAPVEEDEFAAFNKPPNIEVKAPEEDKEEAE